VKRTPGPLRPPRQKIETAPKAVASPPAALAEETKPEPPASLPPPYIAPGKRDLYEILAAAARNTAAAQKKDDDR